MANCSTDNRPTQVPRRRLVVLLILGMVAAAGGCARSTSTGWAQTAPVIRAESTTSAEVYLGMRGG